MSWTIDQAYPVSGANVDMNTQVGGEPIPRYGWMRIASGSSEWSRFKRLTMESDGILLDRYGVEILGGEGPSSTAKTSVIWQATGTPATGYVIGDSAALTTFLTANPTVNMVYFTDGVSVDSVLDLGWQVSLAAFNTSVVTANSTPPSLLVTGAGVLRNPANLLNCSVSGGAANADFLVMDLTAGNVTTTWVNVVVGRSPSDLASPNMVSVTGPSGNTLTWVCESVSMMGMAEHSAVTVADGLTVNLVADSFSSFGNDVTSAIFFGPSAGTATVNVKASDDSVVPLVAQSLPGYTFTGQTPAALAVSAVDTNSYLAPGQIAYPLLGPSVQDFITALTASPSAGAPPTSVIWKPSGAPADGYVTGDDGVLSAYLALHPTVMTVYFEDAVQVNGLLNLNYTVTLFGASPAGGAGGPPFIQVNAGGQIQNANSIFDAQVQGVANTLPVMLFDVSAGQRFTTTRNVQITSAVPTVACVSVVGGANEFTWIAESLNMPASDGVHPVFLVGDGLNVSMFVSGTPSTLGANGDHAFVGPSGGTGGMFISFSPECTIPLNTPQLLPGFTIVPSQAQNMAAVDSNSYMTPSDQQFTGILSVQDFLNKLTGLPPQTQNTVRWLAAGASSPGVVPGTSTALEAYLSGLPTGQTTTILCDPSAGPLVVDSGTIFGGQQLRLVGLKSTMDPSGFASVQVNFTGSGQIISPLLLQGLYLHGVSNTDALVSYDSTPGNWVSTMSECTMDTTVFNHPLIETQGEHRATVVMENVLLDDTGYGGNNVVTVADSSGLRLLVTGLTLVGNSATNAHFFGPSASTGSCLVDVATFGCTVPAVSQDLATYAVSSNTSSFITYPDTYSLITNPQYTHVTSVQDALNQLAIQVASDTYESWTGNTFGPQAYVASVPARPSASGGTYLSVPSRNSVIAVSDYLIYSPGTNAPSSMDVIVNWQCSVASTGPGTLFLQAAVDGGTGTCVQTPNASTFVGDYSQYVGQFLVQSWTAGALRMTFMVDADQSLVTDSWTISLRVVNSA